MRVLASRMDDFYLAGGTALSLYYFNHRESQDLDFFTQEFSKKRIEEIVKFLSISLKKKMKLIAEQTKRDKIRVSVYSIPINKKASLKIDFVEDYIGLARPPKSINGIKVSSLEDIYTKKIYTVAGTCEIEDSVGRKIARGHREEAKDFFDLYCLSHTFMRLSEFSFKYSSQVTREGIIRWFRTYSRLDMKTGILELEINKAVDYHEIERHFKKEVNKIIEEEVDFL